VTTPDQPGDRGICGTDAPTLTESTRGGLCTLLAGHTGWHRADDGMSWTDRPGFPAAGSVVRFADMIPLSPTQGDVDAAYERGVAEGRRQATEGWDREWAFENRANLTIPIAGDDVLRFEAMIAQRQAAGEETGRLVSRLVGPWEPAEQTQDGAR
jgi:hypothetical protein